MKQMNGLPTYLPIVTCLPALAPSVHSGALKSLWVPPRADPEPWLDPVPKPDPEPDPDSSAELMLTLASWLCIGGSGFEGRPEVWDGKFSVG